MTRDYAKKTHAPAKRAPLPPWLWLLTGLLIGLFVAFLVYINHYSAPAEAPRASKAAPKPTPEAVRPAARKAPAPSEQTEGSGVRFDFYKILPEYEVVIPEEDLTAPKLQQAAPGRYILQAGSFKTAADADTRKAQLALLGLSSRVQTVTIDGRETWHRVQLGPYGDLKKLDQVRTLLQDNGIEFLLLKVTG